MGTFVKGIASIFGGGADTSAAQAQANAQAQQQRDLANIAQNRQEQAAQDQSADTAKQLAAAKPVRGRRLLLSGDSGGLASTLGGSA
jgi:hypothetical protein